MKHLFVLAVLLTVAWPSEAAQHAPRDQQDVEATLDRFLTAFNNLDWDRFRESFADDATVFNPEFPGTTDPGRRDGREQFEAVFKAVFDAARRRAGGPPYLHIAPINQRVQMLGDTAIVSFEFNRDGDSRGRRTIVFTRRDGTWKIVHIHASNVSGTN